MALQLITSDQANDCTIEKCSAVYEGGDFLEWHFLIKDTDGFTYPVVISKGTADMDANAATLKSAIHAALVSMMKQVNVATVVGDTVG